MREAVGSEGGPGGGRTGGGDSGPSRSGGGAGRRLLFGTGSLFLMHLLLLRCALRHRGGGAVGLGGRVLLNAALPGIPRAWNLAAVGTTLRALVHAAGGHHGLHGGLGTARDKREVIGLQPPQDRDGGGEDIVRWRSEVRGQGSRPRLEKLGAPKSSDLELPGPSPSRSLPSLYIYRWPLTSDPTGLFITRSLPFSLHLSPGSHLELAPSVELLEFSLGGVHVGEAGGLPQDPGMVQGLADAEALPGVQDNQLTDLSRTRPDQTGTGQDRTGQSSSRPGKRPRSGL